MLKRIIQRMVKKLGMVGLLMMIGDYAVGATKSKKDDEIIFNGIGKMEHETFILSKNARTVAYYEGEDLSFNLFT